MLYGFVREWAEDSNMHVGLKAKKHWKERHWQLPDKGSNTNKSHAGAKDYEDFVAGTQTGGGTKRIFFRYPRVVHGAMVVPAADPQPNTNRNGLENKQVLHPPSVTIVRYSTIKN